MRKLVCYDLDGLSPWQYDPEDKKYYRLNFDGETERSICGNDLPNPDLLWSRRMRKLKALKAKKGEQFTVFDVAHLKPSDTTFALWNHWKEISDAHPHHEFRV